MISRSPVTRDHRFPGGGGGGKYGICPDKNGDTTATNQKKGYMAITTHYVDNHSILRGHLLSFPYVPALHISEKLTAVLHDLEHGL
ncbi:hypothetical protein LINGRAHAP2_LOCUS30106 [Linum grandiflorum]